MNLPNTRVKSKKVVIEGGTSPTKSTFGATSAGMFTAFIAIITMKNEMSRVTPKNVAKPVI